MKNNKMLPILIFSFFFLIYISTSGGHGDPYDGPSYFLISENLALNGSPSMNINSPSQEQLGFDVEYYIQIRASLQSYDLWYNQFHSIEPNLTVEELLKKYPFGEFRDNYLTTIDKEAYLGPAYVVLPLLASPLYKIALMLDISPISFVFLLLNSIILSTSCLLIFYLGKNIFESEKIGFAIALIFGITSFIWPYITSMYARPLAILFFILALNLILNKNYKFQTLFSFFAGLSIGLSILSHIHFIMISPIVMIFGIYEFRKQKKQMLMLVFGFIIMMSVQAYFNYERFEDFTNFTGFLYPGGPEQLRELEGVYGYIFSSGNSIIIYFPLTLLYPFGLYYLFKIKKSVAILFFILSIIIFFYIATDPVWNQGSAWGPHRYLLPLIPMIAISVGSLIKKFSSSKKWSIGIITLASIGFIVNLLGNLVWIQYARAYGWGPEGLWKIEDKGAVFAWNPFHSPIIQNIKVLATDWTSTLPVNPIDMNYFKIGLNGCSVDLFIFCQYGIIPIILIISAIILICYFIIRNLFIQIQIKVND